MGLLQIGGTRFRPRVGGTTRLEFFGNPYARKTGFKGLYTAVTAGVTYKPQPSA